MKMEKQEVSAITLEGRVINFPQTFDKGITRFRVRVKRVKFSKRPYNIPSECTIFMKSNPYILKGDEIIAEGILDREITSSQDDIMNLGWAPAKLIILDEEGKPRAEYNQEVCPPIDKDGCIEIYDIRQCPISRFLFGDWDRWRKYSKWH